MQGFGQVGQQLPHPASLRENLADGGDRGCGIVARQPLEYGVHMALLHAAEHVAHIGLEQFAAAGQGLVEQAQAVAHAAVGGPGQQFDGGVLSLDSLGFENPAHLTADLFGIEAPQVELQAARENGHRDLLRIGGRQHELDVLGRLLERFQQCVEAVPGEHVDFVDQVDLEAPPRRCVLDVVENLARIVDLGARGGINLEEVDETSLVDRHAVLALPARGAGDALLAIERLGQDARDGRLAHTPGSGEQKGMVHPALGKTVAEHLDDVGLTDQLGEITGTPLSGKYLITH